MSKKVYRIEEKLVLVLFLVVGLFGIAMSLKMGNPLNQSVGPSVFPTLLSAIITLCALFEIYRIFLRPNAKGSKTEISLQTIKELVLMAAILFVSVAVWNWVGYIPAIICGLFSVAMYDFKNRMMWGLFYIAGIAFVMWGLFFEVLGLS